MQLQLYSNESSVFSSWCTCVPLSVHHWGRWVQMCVGRMMKQMCRGLPSMHSWFISFRFPKSQFSFFPQLSDSKHKVQSAFSVFPFQKFHTTFNTLCPHILHEKPIFIYPKALQSPGQLRCRISGWVSEGYGEWTLRTEEGICGGQSAAPHYLIWNLSDPLRRSMVGTSA